MVKIARLFNNYSYLFIAILFAFSFFSKLLSFSDFVQFVSHVFKTSEYYSLKLSVALLSIEFFIFFYLLIDKKSRFVIIIALILTIFFTVFAVYLLILNYSNNCYCFGSFLELSPFNTLIKNIFLILILFHILKQCDIRRGDYFKGIILILATFILFSFILTTPVDFLVTNPKTISVAEAINQNNVIFIDARDQASFNIKHISGAINIPYHNQTIFDKTFLSQIDKIDGLPKGSIIVIYCDNKICNLSKSLAKIIIKRFPSYSTYYLDEGFDKWPR
jgi:rhodanese-related sulfurtransferase